jgi:hypothetical protein
MKTNREKEEVKTTVTVAKPPSKTTGGDLNGFREFRG